MGRCAAAGVLLWSPPVVGAIGQSDRHGDSAANRSMVEGFAISRLAAIASWHTFLKIPFGEPI